MRSQEVNVIAKPKLGKTNNRNSILYRGIQELGAKVDDFKLRKVILKNYDILHIHWPDRILSSKFVTVKLFLLTGLFFFVWLKNAKIIYTVHNPSPKIYQKMWQKKIYFRIITSWVDAFIFPSMHAQETWHKEIHYNGDNPKLSKIIPLGLQDEIVSKGNYMPIELGAYNNSADFLLFVGRLTLDKEFPAAVLELLKDPRFMKLKIVVAGAPKDQSVVNSLCDIEKQNKDRLLVVSRFLEDTEINWLIKNCSAVVINYNAVNSGVATLALAHEAKLVVYNDSFRASLKVTYGPADIYTLDEYHDELNGELEGELKRMTCLSGNRLTMRLISRNTLEFYKEVLEHEA